MTPSSFNPHDPFGNDNAEQIRNRKFQQDLEWKQVVFERTWDKAVKKWEHNLTRTDGRTVKKPDQSDPENIGLS